MSEQAYLASDIYCPRCKGRLPGYFAQHSGPIVHIHTRGKIGHRVCNARLIVLPHDHRAYEVADHESVESALIRAIKGAA